MTELIVTCTKCHKFMEQTTDDTIYWLCPNCGTSIGIFDDSLGLFLAFVLRTALQQGHLDPSVFMKIPQCVHRL